MDEKKKEMVRCDGCTEGILGAASLLLLVSVFVREPF
jgi:hypothetical protein